MDKNSWVSDNRIKLSPYPKDKWIAKFFSFYSEYVFLLLLTIFPRRLEYKEPNNFQMVTNSKVGCTGEFFSPFLAFLSFQTGSKAINLSFLLAY